MSSLSKTHLRQARSFLHCGDPVRAVELLEQARALARDDQATLREVTAALADAYARTGDHERAARCQEWLQSLPPAPRDFGPSNENILVPLSTPPLTRRQHPYRPYVLAVLILLFIVVQAGLFFGYRWYVSRQNATAPAGVLAPGLPMPPSAAIAPPPVIPSAANPTTIATSAATPSLAGSPIEELVRENVGLLIVSGHYEGAVDGRPMQIDVPIATGSAFAVTKTGILLTNRHVTSSAKGASVPASLQALGFPTLTLRSTSYQVCFGPSAPSHFQADLVHESDSVDLAILRAHRQFGSPLQLADQPPRQGQEVLVAGYPGVIQEVFNEQYLSQSKVREAAQQLRTAGQINLVDAMFSPEAFKSTLCRGIVSVRERNIEGVAHTQFDAKVSAGDSGGPLMDMNGRVLAIITLAGHGDAAGYNFGILVDQVRDEVSAYSAAP